MGSEADQGHHTGQGFEMTVVQIIFAGVGRPPADILPAVLDPLVEGVVVHLECGCLLDEAGPPSPGADHQRLRTRRNVVVPVAVRTCSIRHPDLLLAIKILQKNHLCRRTKNLTKPRI